MTMLYTTLYGCVFIDCVSSGVFSIRCWAGERPGDGGALHPTENRVCGDGGCGQPFLRQG